MNDRIFPDDDIACAFDVSQYLSFDTKTGFRKNLSFADRAFSDDRVGRFVVRIPFLSNTMSVIILSIGNKVRRGVDFRVRFCGTS